LRREFAHAGEEEHESAAQHGRECAEGGGTLVVARKN
jgi:hypothetical protein